MGKSLDERHDTRAGQLNYLYFDYGVDKDNYDSMSICLLFYTIRKYNFIIVRLVFYIAKKSTKVLDNLIILFLLIIPSGIHFFNILKSVCKDIGKAGKRLIIFFYLYYLLIIY